MSSDVAYVVSRFPKTTETFIAREMAAVADAGRTVELVALRRERGELLQTDAARFLDRLVAVSDLGVGDVLAAQARSFLASPRRWATMWFRAIWGNRTSLKFLSRGLVAAAGAPALAVHLERRRVGQLHAHWGTHAALLAYLLHILTDIPFSVTLHAHDLHVDRTMLDEKLAAASAVVTISDHNRELIEELYPEVRDRLEVVHCGVDTAAITPRPIEERKPTGRVATVAGLRAFKGHRHLLEAFAVLVDDGFVVDLDLVGDGPLRATLEAHAHELGIEKLVHFHGAVDVERAMEIVAGADVAVMPSVVLPDGRRDGIPVALIEAMALGTPVVATAVSGIPELVRDGETGLLVESGDSAALADGIRTVLERPVHAADRARAGRALVEGAYDIRTTGASMIGIWERLSGRVGEGVQMSRAKGPRVAIVVLAALIGGFLASVWGSGQSEVYRAEAVLTFAPAADLTVDADVIDVIGALDRGSLPQTAAGLATSGSVREESAARIALTEGLGQYKVTASPVFEANLLDVVTRGPDPVVAAELTNAVADVLAERVEGLYQVYVVDVVTRATPPDAEGRNLGLLVVAAALLAAALAAAAIVALDRTAVGPEPRGST